MFAACPIDDDQKTYRHRNPHSKELTDPESEVLRKLSSTISIGGVDKKWKLHELAVWLEIRKPDPLWFALRTVLNIEKYFTMVKDHDRIKYYTPNMDAIREKVNAETFAESNRWTRKWGYSRPYIDVESTIEKLETDKEYDTTKPIRYSIGEIE